jgi:endonuclease YncB( thermonuclease family)
MRKAALALAVGGLAVLAALMLFGRAAWQPQQPEQTEVAEAPSDEADVAASVPIEQPAAPVNARPVAPDVVAIPEVEPETLVRVAPREPLSPFAKPLPPPKPDYGRIHRPLAEAAGRILGQGLMVEIAGLDIVEPDEFCIDPDGVDWPCGMHARTAFRGLLRGRAVSCDIPPDFEGSEIAAGCTLGKLDLGQWIVANGWARAVPGGPYVDAEKAAREAEKGIFGTGPLPLPIFTEVPNFMAEQ